jgi:predicted metal-dependent peptidase
VKYYSGGGTDMPEGLRFIEAMDIQPDVFITLTDGYTPWPEHADFPLVWVIPKRNDINAPIGKTLHY